MRKQLPFPVLLGLLKCLLCLGCSSKETLFPGFKGPGVSNVFSKEPGAGLRKGAISPASIPFLQAYWPSEMGS